MKHVQMIIKGRVQGVFFRKSTLEFAQKHQIKGIVKNLPDGTVAVEAEAPEPLLNQFIEWCHQGPPSANVEQVIVTEADVKGYNDFQIVY